jgi:hypothetical protein
MSGDWRRLHQVRGVCSGLLENHLVTRLSDKAEVEDQAWLSRQNRIDRFGEPVWPVWGRRAPEALRRRTHVGIARLASRLREVRSPGIRVMVLQRQIPKMPLVGVYPSLGFRGILVFRRASRIDCVDLVFLLFEGFLLDVTHEDLVPLCLVILIQQTLRNDFDLGVFSSFYGKVFMRLTFGSSWLSGFWGPSF